MKERKESSQDLPQTYRIRNSRSGASSLHGTSPLGDSDACRRLGNFQAFSSFKSLRTSGKQRLIMAYPLHQGCVFMFNLLREQTSQTSQT